MKLFECFYCCRRWFCFKILPIISEIFENSTFRRNFFFESPNNSKIFPKKVLSNNPRIFFFEDSPIMSLKKKKLSEKEFDEIEIFTNWWIIWESITKKGETNVEAICNETMKNGNHAENYATIFNEWSFSHALTRYHLNKNTIASTIRWATVLMLQYSLCAELW